MRNVLKDHQMPRPRLDWTAAPVSPYRPSVEAMCHFYKSHEAHWLATEGKHGEHEWIHDIAEALEELGEGTAEDVTRKVYGLQFNGHDLRRVTQQLYRLSAGKATLEGRRVVHRSIDRIRIYRLEADHAASC